MTAHIDQRISGLLTKVAISGMQEIIGQPGLEELAKRSQVAILDQATVSAFGLLYSEISALQQALEDIYGPQAARGIALRCGRAALCYLLKELGETSAFHQLEFRLLPPRKRTLTGLERLAELVSRETGQPVQVQSMEKSWNWQVDLCPECWGRTDTGAMCYFIVGLLQEFLSWLSGGRIFLVEETACRAKGDPACVIRIDKKPLD